jgi:hypothetical protein
MAWITMYIPVKPLSRQTFVIAAITTQVKRGFTIRKIRSCVRAKNSFLQNDLRDYIKKLHPDDAMDDTASTGKLIHFMQMVPSCSLLCL